MAKEFIKIGGAREHNLKNLTLSIPRDKLVVITGLRGSGRPSRFVLARKPTPSVKSAVRVAAKVFLNRRRSPEFISRSPRGRATDGCSADDVRSVAREVLVPAMPARVKERRGLAGVGINTAQVRAFVEITLRARESEVVGTVPAAVLAGGDVFDVKAEAGVLLGQAAVFAAVASALADELAGRRVHQAGLL